MSLCLLIIGLLMVVAPLTFLHVKKIMEARRLQVTRLAIINVESQCDSPQQAFSNRLASYAHSAAALANTDKQNFVAENEKNLDGIQSSQNL